MAGSTHERPISGVDELVAHFAGGAKSKSALKIGVEHEKLGVLADGRAPDYEPISQLLEAMAARGWNRVEEGGTLIALGRPTCGSITLEPGGQIEHSGAPWSTALQAVRDNDKHTDELIAAGRRARHHLPRLSASARSARSTTCRGCRRGAIA